jgi:hypothetical protein
MALFVLCVAMLSLLAFGLTYPDAKISDWVGILSSLGTFCVAVAAVFPVRHRQRLEGIYDFGINSKGKKVLCMRVKNIGLISAEIGFNKVGNTVQIGLMRQRDKIAKKEEAIRIPADNGICLSPDRTRFIQYELADVDFANREIEDRKSVV